MSVNFRSFMKRVCGAPRAERSIVTSTLACAAFLGSMAPDVRGDIVWNFDSTSQGWQITDMTCSGPYITPLATYPVLWVATGGDTDGFIQQADPSSYCYFFSAPAADLGNLARYSGGRLSFSLRSTLNDWSGDNVVVLVGSNGISLIAEILPLPRSVWAHYSVTLQAANFRRGSKTGPVATAAEFAAVLNSVAACRISAEFGSVVQEMTGLDRVAFNSWCGADFNGDLVLDFFDYLDFVDAFVQGTAAADVNHDGVVDFFDYLDFVDAFASGC